VYPIHLSIFGSIVLYTLIVIILSLVQGTDLYQMGEWMFKEPSFYFGLVLTIVVCLLPEILVSYIKRTYYPQLSDIIEEKDVLTRHQSDKNEKFVEGWIELARRSSAITKLDKV
jgi:magnesium-transporting ATPase (P-type)